MYFIHMFKYSVIYMIIWIYLYKLKGILKHDLMKL